MNYHKHNRATSRVSYFVIWSDACTLEEHGQYRDAGYVAIDLTSGGCSWITNNPQRIEYFPTIEAAWQFVDQNQSFFPAGHVVEVVWF